MTVYEESLASLLPSDIPSKFNGVSFPSLSHCVGTNKLIGDLYGTAIVEECGLRTDDVEPELSELSCLLRAYIVIDDFVKDHRINIQQYASLSWVLGNIKERCIKLISIFTPDASLFWDKCYSVYEEIYERFNTCAIYDSIVHKCYLIFLPFELPLISATGRCSIVRNAMMDFLFCLQLMDDFQDMEEDLTSPKNHNLFVAGLSERLAQSIISCRPLIARSLFDYIEHNVTCIYNSFTGETARKSVEHSLEWIRHKKGLLQKLPYIEIFRGKPCHYFFDSSSFLRLTSIAKEFSVPELEDIRAESMHTNNNNYIC